MKRRHRNIEWIGAFGGRVQDLATAGVRTSQGQETATPVRQPVKSGKPRQSTREGTRSRRRMPSRFHEHFVRHRRGCYRRS